MRTAACHIILAGNARPTSQATLAEAADSIARLAGEPPSAVRFAGYDNTAHAALGVDIPAGARVARYEADYPDTITATTLANVAPTLRPPRVI